MIYSLDSCEAIARLLLVPSLLRSDSDVIICPIFFNGITLNCDVFTDLLTHSDDFVKSNCC